jgi:streptogramin lyase
LFHRVQSTLEREVATTLNPWGIALDEQNGYVWVAEPGCDVDVVPKCLPMNPGKLGKFSLADGSLINEYQEAPNVSNPMFVAVASNGHVWFTEPVTDSIGEFDPVTTNFTNYALPKGVEPRDLIFDKNGNLWFTEFAANAIGFLDTKTHNTVQNTIPGVLNSQPYGIAIDRNGNIWFAENRESLGLLGSFTPTASGKVTMAQHDVNSLQPHLLVADKNGNIWFSEAFGGAIGEYIPGADATNHFAISTNICPVISTCSGTHISGISIDKNGNVWFTDSLSGRIGYIVPATGALHAFTFAIKNVHPHDGLVVDSHNTVWFTQTYGRILGMLPGAKLPTK